MGCNINCIFFQAQVHFIGNIVIWLSGTMSLVAYTGLFIIYLLRRQRACYDLPEGAWNQFCTIGEVSTTNSIIIQWEMGKGQVKCYVIMGRVGHLNWEVAKMFPLWQVLGIGFAIHYFPYFLVDRTLFLHHYMPAYLFKVSCCHYSSVMFNNFPQESSEF